MIPEFNPSIIFGMLLIAFYSWHNLNQPASVTTDLKGMKVQIVQQVKPRRLFSFGVFLKSFLVYILFLEIIYLTLALVFPGLATMIVKDSDVDKNLLFPVALSLIVVGQAPDERLAVVRKFLNLVSHRSAGIAGRFFDLVRSLRDPEISIVNGGRFSGLNADNQEKILAIHESAKSCLGEEGGDDLNRLLQALIRIAAYLEWRSARSSWPPEGIVAEFSEFKSQVDIIVDAAVEDLLDMAHRRPEHSLAARWRALTDRADHAAEEACTILALFACRAGETPHDDSKSPRILAAIFDDREKRSILRAEIIDAYVMIIIAVFILDWVFKFLIYQYKFDPRFVPGNFFQPAVDAFAFLATMISAAVCALCIRESRGRKWRNYFDPTVKFPTSQYFSIILAAGFSSALVYLLMSISGWSDLYEENLTNGISDCPLGAPKFSCFVHQKVLSEPSLLILGIAMGVFALAIILVIDLRARGFLKSLSVIFFVTLIASSILYLKNVALCLESNKCNLIIDISTAGTAIEVINWLAMSYEAVNAFVVMFLGTVLLCILRRRIVSISEAR